MLSVELLVPFVAVVVLFYLYIEGCDKIPVYPQAVKVSIIIAVTRIPITFFIVILLSK